MKDLLYIEGINIVNNRLNIVVNKAIDTLVLVNKELNEFVNIKESIISLEDIIKAYDKMLVNKFSLTVYNNEVDELANIKVKNSRLNKIEYLYKGLTIKVENETYYVDIYINEENLLCLDIIKFIDKKTKVYLMSSSTLNNKLKIKIDTNKSIFTDEELKNSKIMMYSSVKNYSIFDLESYEDGIVSFDIELDQLYMDEDVNIYTSFLVGEKSTRLSFDREICFKPINIKVNDSTKNISVCSYGEYNALIVNVCSKIEIEPVISNVVYNDEKLVFRGTINSSIDISDIETIQPKMVFKNKNTGIVIQNDIKLEDNVFTYEIPKEDLFNIKNLSIHPWIGHLELESNDETIESKAVYVDTDDSNLLFEGVVYDRDHINVSVNNIKNELSMSISSKIVINNIMSISAKKSSIAIKYRTEQQVNKMLDQSILKTNVLFEDKELICKKIEKKGKKTYVCHYESTDPKKDIEGMLKRGVTLISKIEGLEYKTYISEINKHAIYYSFWDVVQSSKKYKAIATKLYNSVFLKAPVKKKRVMFESFLGRNVSGNPKYIYEYFVEQGLDKKYELIWILNNTGEDINGRCKQVKRKTIKYYYYMATSGYWVFNVRQANEIVKREETTYLQTWHGTPLKLLGADMFNSSMAGVGSIEEYQAKFKQNSSRWDYLIAQNDYSDEIFKRAFYFDKEMLTYGYPANDILYNKDNEAYINKLKDKFNIPKDKKVLLYCPTWREDNFYKKGHYKMSLELDLDLMKKELGDEYVVLLRLHYLITNSINIEDYKGFAYDFSGAYDIQELYLVSDIMMTDYSSTMFDFANLNRRSIFFTYDLEKYRDSLRGFYFDFPNESPGPLASSTEEVIYWMKNLDEIDEKYDSRKKEFYDKFCDIDDGNSSKRIVDRVFFNKKWGE